MKRDLVQHRRAEIPDEARVLAAAGSHARDKAAAEHHPVARFDHVRGTARLAYDHPGHVVIGYPEINRGRVVILLVRPGDITIGNAIERHRPHIPARNVRGIVQQQPGLDIMSGALPGLDDGSRAFRQRRRERCAAIRHDGQGRSRRRRSIAINLVDLRLQQQRRIRQRRCLRGDAERRAVQAQRPRRPHHDRARQGERCLSKGPRAACQRCVRACQQRESRTAQHHFTAGHACLYAIRKIAVQPSREAAQHIMACHADEVGQRTRDLMLDARIMETFLGAVLHRANRHRLRCEPVVRQERQRVQRRQRAV